MQENDDEAKIHIGNCVTLEQPAKKYAQPISESPKYARKCPWKSLQLSKLISINPILHRLEFPSNCRRSRQSWQICRSSSPVTIAAMVVCIQISVFTYQNQTNRHHSVRNTFGVRAIHRTRRPPTMAPNQRKILPTMRSSWCPATSPKWVNFVTTPKRRLDSKLPFHCQLLAFSWGEYLGRMQGNTASPGLISIYCSLRSKHMYEVIYNRIISNLLLWTPSAPVIAPKVQPPSVDASVLQNVGMADSVFMPFSMAKSNIIFGEYEMYTIHLHCDLD